ncbi:coiled-coil domain-containing protein 93 isoform X3 [Syngnathoides biaculeatus]|uniref:coiled-coil domain-containing protein 93 isoform X3 n=1 Tax=Syngnathoides biaculeatus TaxID=300417 RepID=UPI002ADDEE5B|nr:coiled-coil domain-containing protein 93 isoform X3 [Syngnathoides biaculeatus]
MKIGYYMSKLRLNISLHRLPSTETVTSPTWSPREHVLADDSSLMRPTQYSSTVVNMAATVSGFYRGRHGQFDQCGNIIQVAAWEDEEQWIKLAEILELLLAAGYFRARIKGLSPFDKVVGGMTWCITTCNYDIDIDLLFQENSTIGQKIALTEKIVSVLPKMKCPHHLEPHQVQGLDFIHIFPVIQWLVKRAMETREQMGDYVRAYSISQFQKTYNLPEDEEFHLRRVKAVGAVLDVLEVYKPQRKYKRQKEAIKLLDEESKVQSTLLEYGRRFGFSKQSKQDQLGEKMAAQDSKVSEEEVQWAVEEIRITSLMNTMAAMTNIEGQLTASAVGYIVGQQSEEIKLIASEYADKPMEVSADFLERFGPLHQHLRAIASLNKQIQKKVNQCGELQVKHAEVEKGCGNSKIKLIEVTEQSVRLMKELIILEGMEGQADSSLLEKLRSLVTMNENLKIQEQDFRTHCRDEMIRLQKSIDELGPASGLVTGEDKERNQLIDKQHSTDREKLHKLRLLMARRNRDIAILQRKIDEVPCRAELTQYQKRFIELSCQVCATHKETKQFFTLYNTLDDKKVYLEKEVNLLNSIHDNFQLFWVAVQQFLSDLQRNNVALSGLFWTSLSTPSTKIIKMVHHHIGGCMFEGSSIKPFQTGGLEGMGQFRGRHVHQISLPWTSFYGPVLKILCIEQR